SRADAYFGTEADHIAQHPAFAYFAGLPGEHGLSGDHFATWLTAGSGQLHWDQLADGFGIKALPVGHSGRAPGLWAKADLDRLPDIAGRTINASALATAVAKEFGAVPAAGDDGDLREVPMGITAAVADGVTKHHKVWFPDGIHWQGLAQSFGMQAGLWHGLSDSDRAIISSCASESYHQCLAEHDAHDKAVAPHLFASQGIARRPLPDDVRRAIAHVAEGLVLHAATQHEATANVHESYMLFRQSFVGDPPIGVAGALV
ncbi:MAG: hypothetical protein ACR2PA_16540, partial [Hyphomicrobiaceae bacterium]